MMIRIKQVSVKPYIKRPLRKGVSYKPPQLSSWRLFSKKTDVLVHWQTSDAHRRWPTARLSEKSSMHAEIFFSGFKIYGLWNPNERQRGLFFLTAQAFILIPGPFAWGWCLCGPIMQEPRMTPCGTVQWLCLRCLIVHFHTTVGLCCELRRFSVWPGRVTGAPWAQLLRREGPSRNVSRRPEVWGSAGLSKGVVQSRNSVGFIEDLFSLVCCSIKLREEKFWTASSSLVDMLILTQ